MRGPLTTLVSAAERVATREETIAELGKHDLHPLVILNTPDRKNWHMARREAERLRNRGYEVQVAGNPHKGWGNKNNALSFRVAFLEARSRGHGLLYCEDDITLADDFPWFLQEAISADCATWFYAHERNRKVVDLTRRYGKRVWERIRAHAQSGTPFQPRGLYTIRDSETLMSGQCFYLPPRVLDALPLHELDRQTSPVDRWSQHRVNKIGEPMLIALPHPVQHRHDRTGREASHNPKASITFDLR